MFDRFGRLLLCVVPTTINAEPSVEFYPLSLGILKIPRDESRPISRQVHPQNRFHCPFPTPFYIIAHTSLQKLVNVRPIWAVTLVRGTNYDKRRAERGVLTLIPRDSQNPEGNQPTNLQTGTPTKPIPMPVPYTVLHNCPHLFA
jgi:hypothetical protein